MAIKNRITAATFDVADVAAFLKKNGIAVKKTTPMSEDEDAAVVLNDLVHVQVGYGYAVVNYWTNKKKDTMMMGVERTTLDAKLLADIKKALKK